MTRGCLCNENLHVKSSSVDFKRLLSLTWLACHNITNILMWQLSFYVALFAMEILTAQQDNAFDRQIYASDMKTMWKTISFLLDSLATYQQHRSIWYPPSSAYDPHTHTASQSVEIVGNSWSICVVTNCRLSRQTWAVLLKCVMKLSS